MSAPKDTSSQSDFLQRQITGLEVRINAAEKAIVNRVAVADTFVKRYAEILILVGAMAGYTLGHFLK